MGAAGSRFRLWRICKAWGASVCRHALGRRPAGLAVATRPAGKRRRALHALRLPALVGALALIGVAPAGAARAHAPARPMLSKAGGAPKLPGASPTAGTVTPGSVNSDVQLTNVYADGHTVVAVGSNGRIITSTDDGLTWTADASPVGINLRGVAYGGGEWVAVGDAGVGAISSNGLDWSSVYLGVKGGFRAVTYNGTTHTWIAGGFLTPLNGGAVQVSSDGGQTWSAAPITNPGVFWGGTTNGPLSILTGNEGEMLLHRGNSWRTIRVPDKIVPFDGVPIPQGGFIWQVVHGADGYVAVGSEGMTLFSKNAQRWFLIFSPLSQVLRGVACGDGRYVAVGEDGQIGVSSNGLFWTLDHNVPTVEDLRGVAFTGDAFIAVGDFGQVLRSTNGIDWTLVLDGTTNQLNGVTYGAGRFVAVGADGRILTSPDGSAWTPQQSPTSEHLYGVAYAHGRFVAVGARGTVLTSTDGIHWTSEFPLCFETLRTVAYLDGQWIAGGDKGVWFTSQDGLFWQPQLSLAFSLRQFAQAPDGELVVAGAGIIAARQPGQLQWQLVESGLFHFFKGLAFGQSLFTAVGNVGGIRTSSDGLAWTLESGPTTENLTALGYANGLWVTTAPGFLATSTNATSWTPVAIPTQSTVRSIIHADGRWVGVGDFGLVLTSTNGSTWTAYQV